MSDDEPGDTKPTSPLPKDNITNGNGNGNGNGVIVRSMRIDDLATVFHMGERLFRAEDVPNLYRSWDEYEVVGLFYDDAQYCFVAEIDERVCGFLLGTTVKKRRSAWKYGYLVWMGVDPESQRFGVGEKLFGEFQAAMLDDGVRMLLVDTEADNHGAIRFFEGLGFGNTEDHVYMTMNLSSLRKKMRLNRAATGAANGNGKPV